MKKVLLMLLCALLVSLCACGTVAPQGVPPQEFPPEEEVVTFPIDPDDPNPYTKVLKALKEEGKSSNMQYALYGTNGRGAYVLLLGYENPISQVEEIYTINDGVAELKLSVGSDPLETTIIMWDTGVVSAGQRESINRYYRLEDGQLKLIAGLGMYEMVGIEKSGGFRIDPTGDERDFLFDYTPDGTEIPLGRDEWNGLLNELLGDRKPAELDWHPLSEYGQ